MNKQRLVLIIFFLLNFLYSSSIDLKKIDIKKGLSHNNVLDIMQDSRGFLWIGTHNGLNRYDGYQVKIYRNNRDNKNSISGNVISTIFEDSENYLWIGTEGNGLNRFNRKNNIFKRFTVGAGKHQLSHSEVKSIVEDKSGNIWIATYGGGINKYNKATDVFTQYYKNNSDTTSISSDTVNVLFVDSQNTLWIGTEGNGLNKYISEKDCFKRYAFSSDINEFDQDSHLLLGTTVNSIHEDKQGNLWIGTWGGGLNKFDKKKESFSHFTTLNTALKSDVILSIDEDKYGNLWLGTWNSGIIHYAPKTNRFTTHMHRAGDEMSPGSNIIWKVFVDQSNTVWFGTWGNGLNKYSERESLFRHYRHIPFNKNSVSSNKVSCFHEDKDGLVWIGTLEGGLNVFDRVNEKFYHYKNDPNDPTSLPSDVVRCLFEDSKKRLWIGTDQGFSLFNEKDNNFKTYRNNPENKNSLSDNRVYSIQEGETGELWVGTWAGGINRFNIETNEFVNYHVKNSGLLSNNVWEIFKDKDGTLWFGTTYGLYQYNRNDNVFIQYLHDPDDSESLSAVTISEIFEDSQGYLWIGTINAGLNRMDSVTEKFKRYHFENQTSSASIFGILEDRDNNFWLSTNEGLIRINLKNLSLDRYTHEDGLQGNSFTMGACVETWDGEMFFGGVNGFNSFYPEKVNKNEYIPPVAITDFQIFNKSITIGDKDSLLKRTINEAEEIVLSYKMSVIAFQFAALNYIIPGKNKYAYKLDGFDKEWNNINTKRTATYTNLDPGKYTLRIKVSNNDGVWNKQGKSVKIIVTPPFWERLWFRLMVLIIIVLIIAISYWQHVKNLVLRKRELEKKIAERTKELEDKNRHLEDALNQIKQLDSLLPICANCKKIRDDTGYWQEVENYINAKVDTQFSHSICPDCMQQLYPDIYKRMQEDDKTSKDYE